VANWAGIKIKNQFICCGLFFFYFLFFFVSIVTAIPVPDGRQIQIIKWPEKRRNSALNQEDLSVQGKRFVCANVQA
jgi:hypothetical protein